MNCPAIKYLGWAAVAWAVAGSMIGCQEPPPPSGVVPPDDTYYIGATACSSCHANFAATHARTGHAQALKAVLDGPPAFPAGPGVPDAPPGLEWPQISYVIGGYEKAATLLDLDGFFLTTGQTGIDTLYNQSIPQLGNTAGYVPYLTSQSTPLPFDFTQISRRTTGALSSADNGGLHQDNRPGIEGTWNHARQGAPSSEASQFELLLNAPSDVAVISVPSWWTLQRLLSAMGALLGTLALAAVWIALLRRQVAQRTLQLQHEIRERERAERKHALEAERTRIARDLHDDLGSSLTEINVLASTGQRPRSGRDTHPALFKAISERARALVAALDVIVWAVDPEDNSLQSLADYLSGYTREYLSNSSVVCRFKIPVTLPTATLDGQIRHEVLMVVKETLNNIVRHSDATEVEFQMNLADDILEVCISDNGKGFDPDTEAGGHGLKNRLARVTKIGGSCHVESNAGMGTTVRIRLPIPPTSTGRSEEANTTFG